MNLNFNHNLNQKIDGQSLEIQKLKLEYKKEISNNQKIYESQIEEIIKKRKENINSNNKNKIMDNAPTLSNSYLTKLSSNNENKFENIKNLETDKYITSVKFFISNSIELSMKELEYYNYERR